jgi:micrococcal nuclease
MSPDQNRNRNFKATSLVAFFFRQPGPVAAAVLVWCLLVQAAIAGDWHVRVEKVLDGDTVVLQGGERLRLRGIDAPEVGHHGAPGQYYGREAGAELSALISGQTLALDQADLGRDRHGRLVGVARRGDGRLVNLAMIEHGAAFVYPHASDADSGLARKMLVAQVTAMARGSGFWPVVLRSPVAQRGYVGNRNSKRFHTVSCPQGRMVGKANRVHFSSLREAFEAGFAPARECTPWPPARGR